AHGGSALPHPPPRLPRGRSARRCRGALSRSGRRTNRGAPLMRYLVLSDLHSNLEALQAALGYARGLRYDAVLVLGDIVGYGADPNAVIETLGRLPGRVAIRGNHDRLAARPQQPGTL